jgi:hypothetical protein
MSAITVAAPPPSITLTVSPLTSSVQTGSTQPFTASVQNDSQNKGVVWMLSGAGCTGTACGMLSVTSSLSGAAVLYTAPAAIPSPATVTLTATSAADGSKSTFATITITAAPLAIVVTVSPMTASVPTGGATQTFTATVQNDSQNKGVNWTLSGVACSAAACGSVSPASSASSAAVTYTSPAHSPTPASITLTATSGAESTTGATATITLITPAAPTASTPLVLGEAGVSEGFGEPVIATDATGNVDVAWINNVGPEFVRSTDAGATFSAPFVIPSDMQDTVEGNQIQMGVDGTGSINLLWHRELTNTGTIPNSFFSRSTDGGATFSTPVNPGSATSAQLIVQPSGRIGLVWFDQTTSNLLAVSSSDGVNFSSPTTVWAAVGSPMDLIVASGPQGQIYLFWTQVVTMTNCSILFSSSLDGNSFTPAAAISGGAGSCNQTSSALVDSQGNVIVAWDADGASLFFSRSTNSGASFSAPISIPTAASPMTPQVAVSPDGTIYIVWATASGESFARSVNGGATFSSSPPSLILGELAVVDSCDNVTTIGTVNGGFMSDQRSTDGGVTFSAPVRISDVGGDFEEQLTIDKDGNVHVVWAVDGPQEIEYVRIPTTCKIHP